MPDALAAEPAPPADTDPDELQPGGKDPAEGARDGGGGGAPAASHPEESHLGAAGDPAEG